MATANTSDGSIYGDESSTTLRAPSTGTFILAICESPSHGTCQSVDTGTVADPMTPYSFTPFVSLVVDPTSTSVSCTPYEVTSGSPIACTLTVTDTASSDQTTPTGIVSLAASPTTATLTNGGACALAGSGSSASCTVTVAPSAAGDYDLTASYPGDPTHSASTGDSGSFDVDAAASSGPTPTRHAAPTSHSKTVTLTTAEIRTAVRDALRALGGRASLITAIYKTGGYRFAFKSPAAGRLENQLVSPRAGSDPGAWPAPGADRAPAGGAIADHAREGRHDPRLGQADPDRSTTDAPRPSLGGDRDGELHRHRAVGDHTVTNGDPRAPALRAA